MIVLTEKELIELTDRKRPTAQARVLDSMGIFYRRRPDKSLAVLRIHVETPDHEPRRLTAPEPVLQP